MGVKYEDLLNAVRRAGAGAPRSDAECDAFLDGLSDGEAAELRSEQSDALLLKGIEERAHWSRAYAAGLGRISWSAQGKQLDADWAAEDADAALVEYQKRFGS